MSTAAEELENMAAAIDNEQAAIEGEQATAEQEAISAQLASDEERARVMALQIVGFVEVGLKMLDQRLTIEEKMYERAGGSFGLVPVIVKHRLFDVAEPPPWVKEYSPYVIAAIFAGSLAYTSYNQLQALKLADEEKKRQEDKQKAAVSAE